MILITGTINALSGIHIGDGKTKGTFIPSMDYIPGRTLRGLLGYYLYKNDKKLFDELGIDEDKDISKMNIFFKNAYSYNENKITIASPNCFKWCKKCETIFKENDKECENIINGKPCLHEGKKGSGLILADSLKNKKLEKPYLFRWNEIPGNDSLSLIEFLIQEFGISWVKTNHKIEKINNDRIIRVTNEKNNISLELNSENTIVNLNTNDGRSIELIAKHENDKLNIYKKLNPKKIETKCPIMRCGHTSPSDKDKLSPYHIESISEGSKFRFKIIVKDEFADKTIEALKMAGVCYGIGGFRSRGYGTIKFDDVKKVDLKEELKKRTDEISKLNTKILVLNSNMVLRENNNSVIGFDETFKIYANLTLSLFGMKPNFELDLTKAKISQSMIGGWSLKNKNSLDEMIPCIGMGSCVPIKSEPNILATLEIYGIGEMINCGYGDVYIIGDII